MVWLIALFCTLLVAALGTLFVMHARAIRRDIDRRFERLQSELEEEAQSVVKDLLDERKRT